LILRKEKKNNCPSAAERKKKRGKKGKSCIPKRAGKGKTEKALLNIFRYGGRGGGKEGKEEG